MQQHISRKDQCGRFFRFLCLRLRFCDERFLRRFFRNQDFFLLLSCSLLCRTTHFLRRRFLFSLFLRKKKDKQYGQKRKKDHQDHPKDPQCMFLFLSALFSSAVRLHIRFDFLFSYQVDRFLLTFEFSCL